MQQKARRHLGTKARSGSLVVVMTLALLTGCATQKPREPVAFEIQDWNFGKQPGSKVITEHYEIYTTLQHRVLLEALPDFVEAAYANYQRLVTPVRQPEGRMRVYLLASRTQWETFTRRFTGSRADKFLKVHNGGYSERGVSVIEYVSHDVTFPLFAHEGFHQYLYYHLNLRIPAWLNEGLAVCCEGQRWGASSLERFDPWFNPQRSNELAAALSLNRLHPLKTLLETDAGRMIEGNSRSIGTYYSEIWALILFLQEGENGKYAADFKRLLAALGDENLEQFARASYIWSESETFNFGEALFRTFISEDLATVEKEYFAFMRTRFGGK